MPAWRGPAPTAAIAGKLAITGFCWGGRITWLYAAHDPRVKAGVAWYGKLVGATNAIQPRHPVDIAPGLTVPVLGLYGEQDSGIPLDSVAQMASALAKGSSGSEFVVYPNAGHALPRRLPPELCRGGCAGRFCAHARLVQGLRRSVKLSAAAAGAVQCPACGNCKTRTRGLKIDPILISILLATTIAGVFSITAAAVFSFALLSKMVERMVSLSVGIMLSTSLLHALPEAFESNADPRSLFATLLAGLLCFFMLEKFAILRHSHHHEGDGHHHAHGHDAREAGKAGWMILIGDGMHNFTDGILIAAAFLANPQLGLVTGLAIIAHEIPQEIGDFIVLLNAGFTRTRAYVFNLLCSLMAVAGGLLGYFTLDRASGLIPYVLVFAASGFIYIAVSDLMPQMQRRATVAESIPQVLLIGLGVIIVLFLTHGH